MDQKGLSINTSLGAGAAPQTPALGSTLGLGQNLGGNSGSAFGSTGFGATSNFGSSTFGSNAGGFGSTAAAPNTGFGASTTTGGFGAPAAASNTGFGATTGGFGSTAAASNTGFGATTGGFGSTAAAPNTGFGASTSTGGFGAPATASNTGFGSSFGNSSFGVNNSSSGFGNAGGFGSLSNSSKPSTGFGFGGNQSFGGLGAPVSLGQSNSFGLSMPGGPMGVVSPIVGTVQNKLFSMAKNYSAVDLECPSKVNNSCKFTYCVYEPNGQGQAGSHPVDLSHPLVEEAEKLNPDPEKYSAVLKYGIPALKERAETQRKIGKDYEEYVKTLQNSLEKLEEKSSQRILKYESLRDKQTNLYFKLLSVMAKLEIQKQRGKPLNHGEIKLRDGLEELRVKAKDAILRLQGVLVVQAHEDDQDDQYVENISDQDIQMLLEVLEEQREGISHLCSVLQKENRDIEIMKKYFSTS